MAMAIAALGWAQEEAAGPSALGSSRADLLAEIGKPLDEIKDKATLKGLFDSILVTTDPEQEQPTAVLYFLNKGVSTIFAVMTYYTPAQAKKLPADKEDLDTTVTDNGFELQDLPDMPDGTAIYYNSDSEEYIFLADDDANGKVKVLFLAYTADTEWFSPMAKVVSDVIIKVQKDLKL